MRFDAKHWMILLLFVLCFLLLLTPQILRWRYTGGNLIGEESFYQLRLAQITAETGQVPSYDAHYAGGSPILAAKGYPFLLSFSPVLFSRLLPLLFGLLTLGMFLLLCQNLDVFTQIVAGLFLIISPPFLYVFSTVGSFAPAIFLSLLALYVYKKEKKYLGIILASCVAFFNIGCALVLFFCFLFYPTREKKFLYLYGLLLSVVLFVTYFHIFVTYDFPKAIFFEFISLSALINNAFIELGSLFGFSLFCFLAALYGGFVYYAKQYRYLLFFLCTLFVILLSGYAKIILFFANFAVAYFAATGVKYLLEKQWADVTLRQLVLLLFVCGFMFSSIAYLHELTSFSPSFSDARGIEFLSAQEKGVVLAPVAYGSWILSSGQGVVLGSQKIYVDDPFVRASSIDDLYRSNHVEKVKEILDTYDVSYIWIDDPVRKTYWDGRSDEGFLQLAQRYPYLFSLVFVKDDVAIWEYHHA